MKSIVVFVAVLFSYGLHAHTSFRSLEFGIQAPTLHFGELHTAFNNRYQLIPGILVQYNANKHSGFRLQATYQKANPEDFFTKEPILQKYSRGFLIGLGYQYSFLKSKSGYVFADLCYQHLWSDYSITMGAPPERFFIHMVNHVWGVRPGMGYSFFGNTKRFRLNVEAGAALSRSTTLRSSETIQLSNLMNMRQEARFAGGFLRIVFVYKVALHG